MAIAQNFPTISPSLLLDFANVEALDPRITFTRASTATYYGTRTALAEQNLLLQSAVPYPLPWAWTDGYIGSLGSELVTNGTFGTDVSGWTAGAGATITWVSGEAQVAGASATKWAFQTITTVIGKRYVFNYKQTGGTGSAIIWVGTSQGTNANGASPTTTAGNTLTSTLVFVATATTTFISLLSIGASLTANFDDLSVKESVQDAAVAPDGTSTASTLVAAAANATYLQTVTANAADYTFSVYLRRVTGTGDVQIQAGSGTYVTQTITSSWARYTVTQTLVAGSRTAGIRLVTSGDQVEVWGAQLEQRSSVTAYTVTTTQPITNYVPVLETAASGVARFDHNPTTFESLGLLIEEQRTNVLLYSEQFENAYWQVKSNLSVTTNTVVSPDGILDGDKLVESTASGQHWIGVGTTDTITSGVAYTLSLYAKQAERGYVHLQGDTGSGRLGSGVTFNLTDGTVFSVPVGSTATITSVGNGWYRCAVTSTASSTGTAYPYFGLRQNSAPATASYTGDGYSGLFIWGAQFETGAFATSYIPTVASQVTRAADSASMTGANFTSWFNAAQGTIYSESLYYYTGDANESDAAGLGSPVAFGDALQNQFEPLTLLNTSTRVRRSSAYYRTALQALSLFESTDNNYPGNTQMKSAVAMAVNDYASSVNGATVLTSAVPFSVVGTRLVIGGRFDQLSFNGTIKKIAYYPLRLSNTNLQALTS